MVFEFGVVGKNKAAMHSALENPDQLEAAIKGCRRDLSRLKSMLRSATTAGKSRHLTNCIILLSGFCAQMKSLQLKIGSGYKKRYPNQVKWEDMQSAFDGCIRTGGIINLSHKDPTSFLKDCQALFRRRINNALKKEAALKVNSIFCGEFKIVKNDEEFNEFKYMNTKNSPIYRDTNLVEWFELNVMSPILKDLEEFQEKDSGWALSSIVNLVVNITNLHHSADHHILSYRNK